MRHEMLVQLKEHEIREQVRSLVASGKSILSDSDLRSVVVTEGDQLDYETIECDYDWPPEWSHRRRLVMLFTSVSEYQLVGYLKFVSGLSQTLPLMDKFCNAVARLKGEKK